MRSESAVLISAAGGRQGPLAMPESPNVLAGPDHWSVDDTVVIHRKAG